MCICNRPPLWLASASLSILHFRLQVQLQTCSITAFECIPNSTASQPPSISLPGLLLALWGLLLALWNFLLVLLSLSSGLPCLSPAHTAVLSLFFGPPRWYPECLNTFHVRAKLFPVIPGALKCHSIGLVYSGILLPWVSSPITPRH